jgi:hypothetical protein
LSSPEIFLTATEISGVGVGSIRYQVPSIRIRN